MIPRFKKNIKVLFSKTNKEEFLLEHNKLSPSNLQATMPLLSRFKIEKPSLFKDDNWSIDKLRRPFILWFMSLDIRAIAKGEDEDLSSSPAHKKKI